MNSTYTIDNGNSHPHIGHFKGSDLVEIRPLNLENFTPSESDRILISDVGKKLYFSQGVRPIYVKDLWKDHSFLGMPVHYSKGLGADRLCNAYYVYKKHLKKSLLLIDSGTFVTFDLITTEGFMGGHIFPGPEVFLQSYQKGQYLPLLDKKQIQNFQRLPQTTQEAIAQATYLYQQSILETICQKYRPEAIILTGGNAPILEGILQDQVQSLPHLIHHALYTIGEEL
jgi:type III pantothenate kinase